MTTSKQCFGETVEQLRELIVTVTTYIIIGKAQAIQNPSIERELHMTGKLYLLENESRFSLSVMVPVISA